MWSRALIAAGLFVSLLISSPASAQMSNTNKARYCAELEGELARLQRANTSRSSRNFEKYDSAIHKQQAQIDGAMQRAKRDGCLGRQGFLFRRTPKPTCPALMKRIDKMHRNLAGLEKKRSRYRPPVADLSFRKAEIARKLGQARCGEQYESFERVHPNRQRRGLFGSLFGQGTIREPYLDRIDIPNVGTYRTVCVRSCDGYFFPISFSTTEGNFARDQRLCQANCPGTDAQLYVYKNPGETPDDMRSVSGHPYRLLQTAFLFRKEYVKGCSCQAPQSQLAALTNSDMSDARPPATSPADELKSGHSIMPVHKGPIIPLPMPKQSKMLDPDTADSQRLGLEFAPYRPPQVNSDKKLIHASDGRSIRIVGPKFFGTPK